MYHKIEAWLNDVLGQEIPSEIRAFCFNLYEDENYGWAIELVGTETFDLDDEDWACDEITDFGTRDEPLFWKKEAGWNEVLSEVIPALKQYLENGSYADVLKSRAGVGVGFVDGNIEILYSNLQGVTQDRIMDQICRPVAVSVYNTERQVQKRSTAVSQRKSWEPAKKAADVRTVMMFLIILVFAVGLIACLYFMYFYNRDTAADKQDLGRTQQENNVGQANEEKEVSSASPTAMPDAASDSYKLSITKLWLNEDEEGAAEISVTLNGGSSEVAE